MGEKTMVEYYTSNIQIIESKLFLDSNSNKKPVCIGWLSLYKTYHCKRNPTKNFHKENNSYSFNFELMRDGFFTNIIVHLPSNETIRTTRKHILKQGFLYEDEKKDCEQKIYLPLKEFGKWRAMSSER
jgi:hypothetical protein